MRVNKPFLVFTVVISITVEIESVYFELHKESGNIIS